MTEEKICQLLNKQYCNSPITAQSKYQNNLIGNASKTIADIIYSTISSESAFTIQKRNNFVQFIRLFCNVNPGHLELNHSNYIHALDLIPNNLNNSEIEKLITEVEHDAKNTTKPLIENIVSHYNMLDAKRKNRSEILDFILEKDQAKLKNFTVHKKVRIEHEVMEDFLSKFICIEIQSKTAKDRKSANRISQVECIYALLNLYQNENVQRYFEMLLKRMSFHKNLIKVEYELLNYIFSESCNNLEALAVAFKYFNFLYEEPTIKLCTRLLSEKDHDGILNSIRETSKMQIIVKIASTHTEIKCKILDMLYELFSMSNYNKNLILLIDIFNKDTMK